MPCKAEGITYQKHSNGKNMLLGENDKMLSMRTEQGWSACEDVFRKVDKGKS